MTIPIGIITAFVMFLSLVASIGPTHVHMCRNAIEQARLRADNHPVIPFRTRKETPR